MMWCTPEHAVFYGGVLHPTGKRFEIKPEDADEMKAHGLVESDRIEASRIEMHDADTGVDVDDKPKRGRPKRNEM